ncbi:hypothetical protein DMN50_21365, partial [Priestia megaterium]
IVNDIPPIKAVQDIKEVLEKECQCLVYNINIPISFLSREEVSDITSLSSKVATAFERQIINLLTNNGFIYKTLEINNTRKIESLLEMVDNSNIRMDTFISGITEDSYYLYNESESSKEKLRKFQNEIHKLITTNNRYWLVFNNKSIFLKILKCKVELLDISDEQLEKYLDKLEKEGGKYLINITNEIYLPFSSEEAREYLSLRDKLIQVKLELELAKGETISGYVFDFIREN